jgi:type I restriction enzyme M protein
MLTTDTKRKIDYLRDVLVGKIPVPSQQIEQITLGLIYKFMSDIDEQNEELGGKSFFSGAYKKYAWKKIMDRSLAGHERVLFYAEGLEQMSRNKELPQLFRDIFKGAFLPFKDPAVLDLFLKGINEFKYEHSEELGNAFEYLLSTAASQGDAGQFRTPRHIIDFIVEVVDPQKEDRILDPACGTAGFLISAYKHILKNNTDKKSDRPGSLLTATERKKLTKNIVGYDISHEMVRLSLVNMYLHGFAEPNIYEYDTLSSLERWDDNFDCLLANPPFMTPKGGIKPHNRFPIQAKRSEVLFVDYITEHLTPNGKAGIIVPEGIIFKNDGAYKQLRKMLVEDGLWAVISLPSGIFNPYSNIRTFILFFSNPIARQTKEILFVKVENDGFDLGAQRRPIDRNDLPTRLEVLKKYRKTVQEGRKFNLSKDEIKFASIVKKEKIAENGDYNLSADHYLSAIDHTNAKWPMVELGEILDYEQPTKYIVNSVNYDNNYNTPVLTAGKTFILGYTNEKEGIFKEKLPIIIFDDFTTAIKFVDFPFKVKSSAMKILHPKKDRVDIKFLYHVMQEIKFVGNEHKRYWISEYSKIKIPLPPLKTQQQIVKKITDEEQKIISLKKEVFATEKKIKGKISEVWGE